MQAGGLGQSQKLSGNEKSLTAYATWMSQAQVNVKDAQGLMRHSRASTTQDVYQQVVPESQRKAVQKLSAFAKQSSKEAVAVQLCGRSATNCNQTQKSRSVSY